MRDYYHYAEIKNRKHREDLISDVIDKFSLIRFLVEDVKKGVMVNGVKESERETVARILGHIEIGIADLSSRVQLLF